MTNFKMKNYGFADGNGNPINRGFQCWPSEAYEYAQKEANDRGITVDFWEEDAESNDDGVNVSLVTVRPEE